MPCHAAEEEISRFQGTQTLWSAEDPTTEPPTIVDLSKQVFRILVQVDGSTKGGTGFLVNGRRVVATNNHVVDKGTDFLLGYIGPQDKVRWVKLQLLAVFPQKDLALLQAVEDLPGQAFPLAPEFPELASDLFAIGFPAAADLTAEVGPTQALDSNFFLPSVVKGSISRIISGAWLTHQLQHQTPISPGYSGGPMVDGRGIVIGVNSAISREASGISYGIAAGDLLRFLTACSLTPRTAHLRRYTRVDTPETTAPTLAPPRREGGKIPSEHLVKRAYEMLNRGDVASARSMFEYTAKTSPSREAYEGLARSYDPIVLQMLRIVGDPSDVAKAHEYYEQARRLDSGAPRPLATVAASRCSNDLCMMQKGQDGTPTVLCTKVR